MTNKILYAIITLLVLAVIGGGLFFLLGNKGAQKELGANQQAASSPSTAAQAPAADTTNVNNQAMVVCGEADGPTCFLNRMSGCLPVTTKMMGSDNKTAIEITILGVENEKCHFQRKLNDVLNLDCRFPKGTLNWDTIDQTFGNDKGLQKVVDDACKPAGW
ncbi:MAG: hypothetical protein NTW60_01760 [Candidatus Wolfebacteria bacterium]|nr:hypothetical protein [Candidatus Wolfebacteria bacterium]